MVVYLDTPPTEDDFENLSEITTEVLADIEFENVEISQGLKYGLVKYPIRHQFLNFLIGEDFFLYEPGVFFDFANVWSLVWVGV